MRMYIAGMATARATARGSRSLSHSEIEKAHSCQASWDFAYGGHLTGGDTLKPLHVLPILSEGRAWGAAVAAWHQHSGTFMGQLHAVEVLHDSLNADFESMVSAGVMMEGVLDQRVEMADRLGDLLAHYVSLAEPLSNLTRLEDTIDVSVPSRSLSGRASSRFRFGGKIDGFTVDANGNEWIVEFKLRGQLHNRKQIELLRQYKRYAWARQRESGHDVVGVIVDERLNELPKPPKIVQATKKADRLFQNEDGVWMTVSHDKAQATTPDAYVELCRSYGVQPHLDVVEALGLRRWQQRVAIPFRPSELWEAGLELVSAAKLIGMLDRGDLYPARNARPTLCNGCQFRAICANPRDELYVNQLFKRTVPKRLRGDAEPEPDVQSQPDLEEAPF